MNNRIHAPHKSAVKPRPMIAGNEQGLAIDEITARAGVSERLVRHCEGRGLIRGAEVANASSRRYTQEDVIVLRFARRAHVLGFGMNEVARLLSLWQDMHRVSVEVNSIALAQPKELTSRTDGIQAMERVLERLANLFSVEHQPTCPIMEGLIELRARVMHL
ncbi:MerR family DNA-binding protein [Undibacterium pigrum]|uniref:DNA-binding transcriptional MerR regulator n=1 Tax=Undibacterium pigrum TaxID=401470 RepID=A0A318JH13_9BURK|nr:MerR family DNA-binding protein [Undibacterium pigrum]PXX47065.1 DNA-binding transcriptional MerR regulator [Undibacterium pigrum]